MHTTKRFITSLVFLAAVWLSWSGLKPQAQSREPVPNIAGKILTVKGPIDPATAGPTLMHEHIFIEFKAPNTAGGAGVVYGDIDQQQPQGQPAPQGTPSQTSQAPQGQPAQQGQGRQGRGGAGRAGGMGGGRSPGWNLLNNFDEQLAEVMEFKKAGGGTIVDVTNFGLSRNPAWLLRISEASGLHVVMGAGWYQKGLHPPDMTERTVDDLTDIVVRDITIGAQGTNIRSGIIGEVGVQGNQLNDNERKSIRASARASRLTGAPITIHSFGSAAEMQETLDIIASEGVDLNHVVMGHTGSGNVAAMKRYTDRGAYIEFDYTGQAPQVPDDGASLRQSAERRATDIKNLIDGGLTDRILVAHDVCTQPQLKKNGGGGFAYVSNLVVPALKAKGVSDETIKKIMVDNPRRVLTFLAPQAAVTAKPAH